MSAGAITVRRHQCSGRTMACVNCGAPLGGKHDILCHAFAKAHKAQQVAMEGSSTAPVEAVPADPDGKSPSSGAGEPRD